MYGQDIFSDVFANHQNDLASEGDFINPHYILSQDFLAWFTDS